MRRRALARFGCRRHGHPAFRYRFVVWYTTGTHAGAVRRIWR